MPQSNSGPLYNLSQEGLVHGLGVYNHLAGLGVITWPDPAQAVVCGSDLLTFANLKWSAEYITNTRFPQRIIVHDPADYIKAMPPTEMLMCTFDFGKQYKYYPNQSHTLEDMTAMIQNSQHTYGDDALEILGIKPTWFAARHDPWKAHLGKYRLIWVGGEHRYTVWINTDGAGSMNVFMILGAPSLYNLRYVDLPTTTVLPVFKYGQVKISFILSVR